MCCKHPFRNKVIITSTALKLVPNYHQISNEFPDFFSYLVRVLQWIYWDQDTIEIYAIELASASLGFFFFSF